MTSPMNEVPEGLPRLAATPRLVPRPDRVLPPPPMTSESSERTLADELPIHLRDAAQRRVRRDGQRTDLRPHHTLVPRALCLVGFLAQFSMTLVVALLVRAGHAERVDGDLAFDEAGARAIVVVGAGALVCYLVGWMWWAVAAALNARLVTSRGVKWWSAPAGYSVVVAAYLLTNSASRSDGRSFGALLVLLLVHFGLLGAYRRTASMIGAPTSHFTRLIVLPWIAGALSGAGSFFLGAAGQPLRLVLFVIVQLVVGLLGLSTYQAMSSWDRAIVANGNKRRDGAALPAFVQARSVSAG